MSRETRDQQLFDHISATYARKDTVLSTAIARQFRVRQALHPILRQKQDLGVIVDIGCGVGSPALYLDGNYQQYIGIDQSEEMIKAGSILVGNHPHIRFQVDNAKSINLPDDSADLILSVGALHHMTALDAVLREMCRIAKPNAQIVFIEPQSQNPLIQILRWLRMRIDKGYSHEQVFFSNVELRSLLQQHQFQNIKIEYQGYFSTPFAQVILPPQWLTAPLSRLSVHIDKWLLAHLPTVLRPLSFDITVVATVPGTSK